VIGAVEQRHLGVHHREADEHARIPHTLHALLHARDVLLGHDTADDLAQELVAGAGLVGLKTQFDARELARAARLLLVRVVDLGGPRQSLAVGHLRRADVHLHLVRALQDVDLDVEVQFAHALDDGLPALLVGRYPERGVLGRELGQRQAHLLDIGLGPGLDLHLDDGIGELHLLEQHRPIGIG
jgi:hypothetical protein